MGSRAIPPRNYIGCVLLASQMFMEEARENRHCWQKCMEIFMELRGGRFIESVIELNIVAAVV